MMRAPIRKVDCQVSFNVITVFSVHTAQSFLLRPSSTVTLASTWLSIDSKASSIPHPRDLQPPLVNRFEIL
jgi:hypothetical protein